MSVRLEHWWLLFTLPDPLPEAVFKPIRHEIWLGLDAVWPGRMIAEVVSARLSWACRRRNTSNWKNGARGDVVLKGIRNQQMHAEWLAGESYASLARRYDLSHSRAHQIVRREAYLAAEGQRRVRRAANLLTSSFRSEVPPTS